MTSAWSPNRPNLVVEQAVAADFARLEGGAMWAEVWAVLTRHPNTLLSYHTVRARLCPVGASDRGAQVVAVAQIVGSTDRAGDFDRAFRPRRRHDAARWQSVARALETGVPLPPVRLRQLGDAYFVVDGHHRVSVARARGQQFIDAAVVEEVVLGPAAKTDRPTERCRWLHRLRGTVRGVRRPAEPALLCETRRASCVSTPP